MNQNIKPQFTRDIIHNRILNSKNLIYKIKNQNSNTNIDKLANEIFADLQIIDLESQKY